LICVLKKKEYKSYFLVYKNSKYFFPLIGAVLDGTQDGYVLAEAGVKHSSIFVVHKFGFSQYIELSKNDNKTFLNILIESLNDKSVNKIINIKKLRVYYSGKNFTNKLYNINEELIESTKRTRLILTTKDKKLHNVEDKRYIFTKLTKDNITLVNEELKLDLCNRFWSNCNECVNKSFGMILKSKDNKDVIGICYSASVSNSCAEIDIFINEKYRKLGYSYQVLNAFLFELSQNNIKALWDCYSNNSASLNLALNSHFEIQYEYDFHIISLY
jgi:hypothetical protein